ncbi:exodeoxyribonuclease VII small subunit [Phytoactinopolyspora limicola]|uniref:exodeoxyribonuclease VII small subunit n=1 Tax=Phytoactinopolyspora limicola TaxID=2715536 RepID=UPI00140B5D84|nr:exodeoxyribonuclease VII small subunit [Phytoactinopolyspora limicola]
MSEANATEPAAAQPAGSGSTTEPTYEQARDELVQIVAKLEAGGTTLEQSLTLWQRGEELAALCERYLEGARSKLDAVTNTSTNDAHANG